MQTTCYYDVQNKVPLILTWACSSEQARKKLNSTQLDSMKHERTWAAILQSYYSHETYLLHIYIKEQQLNRDLQALKNYLSFRHVHVWCLSLLENLVFDLFFHINPKHVHQKWACGQNWFLMLLTFTVANAEIHYFKIRVLCTTDQKMRTPNIISQ